jgi:hypothetical protein
MSENTASAHSCSPYVRSFALTEQKKYRERENAPARLFAKEPCNFYAAAGRISNIESRRVLPISIDGKRALIIKSGSMANLGIPLLRAEIAVHGLHAIVCGPPGQLTNCC